METLIKDLKWSLRMLRRQPGFAAMVIITLALGIGANTALFSVVNAVLLQPLPYHEPERLVRVWSARPEDGVTHGTTSPLDLQDWFEQNESFEDIGGYPALHMRGFVLTGQDRPEEIATSYVAEGFFETLATVALRGRTIERRDHVDGSNTVVVLSHGAWRRRYGADPTIVGQTISLSGRAFTILGVMGPEFEYPNAATEMWAPLSLVPDSGVPRRRSIRWLSVIARLKPGVSIERARAEMATITGRLAQEYPDSNEGLTSATIEPLHAQMVGDIRAGMLTVFAAVGFVLLIGCANIANLVLARAEGRSKEIAVRVALGAGRARLLRQLLTESVLLASIGGVVGMLVGVAGTRYLVAMAPPSIPMLSTVQVDGVALVFTVLLSVATGLLFGTAPALRMAGSNLQGFLKEGARGVGGSGRRGLRSGLVVAEVALVVVLSISASLLIRSYYRLLQVDPGLDPSGVLTLNVTAQSYKYPTRPDYVGFFHDVLERLEKIPGIDSAAMIRPFPLRSDTFEGEDMGFTVPGRPVPPDGQEPEAAMRFTSPNYFRTMRIPLLSGRDFNELDDSDHPLVIIINETAAERYWPDEDPVGSSIQVGENVFPVVGVVGAVQQLSLSKPPEPTFYVNYQQVARVGMTFVLRTRGAPLAAVDAVERAIWEVDPDQPIGQIATMERVLTDSVAEPRFSMTLLSVFAGLALALAAVGIYGVISYTVSQQFHEIGIRMAMGAHTRDVLGMVVRRGMALALTGVAIGWLATWGVSRLLASLLFQVETLDATSYLGATVVLVLVAFAATLLPALRAARIDPVTALRS